MKTINAMMLSLAALTIAGCSQNEVTEISPDAHPQVGFGVYTGVPTRGVDMTTESMKDDPTDANKYGGFGIMAYFTGQDNFETVKTTVTPSFMHNQMVKFDGTNNVWTYSPVKYWPNRQNDKISFFAYAPYESDWQNGSKSGVITSAATAPGIPYIKFKLKTTDKLDKMVDLVVADQRDKTYTAENGGKISFTFEHTLSRISFRAQLGAGDFDGMDGTNSFVYITHMWIVGTDHSADGSNLSLIDPASPVNANSKFYTSAKWSELHWNYEADATIAQADFSLAKGDIKIGFHYDIVSKDATNAGKFIASHGEAFIELPAGHMKRKESYLYTLKINLHKIEISDATVTPWEDIKTEATVE